MRKIQTYLIAGVAVAALTVGGVVAVAGDNVTGGKAAGTNTMTVELPGGGFAHIEYSGAVKPRVMFAESPSAFWAGFDPMWPAPRVLFDDTFEPFAFWHDDIARDMQRIRAMMRELPASALRPPGALVQAGDGAAAAGSYSYSFTSTTMGGKTCARSVQVTAPAGGGKPEVVERTSGECEGAAAPMANADEATSL